MKIIQILNNNAVVLKKGKNELVALASGIGFKKKIGGFVKDEEIDKIFVLDTHELVDHLSYLLSTVPVKHIAVVDEIVKYAEKNLEDQINDYVYLTLIDHLKYATERHQEGLSIKSPLSWEVKKFYKDEYEVGLYGLKVISDRLGFDFDLEEAVSIALHFVNVQTDSAKMNQTIEIISVVQDILNIIQYEFKLLFDESDLSYIRLVTHLRFFAQRILNDENISDSNEHELHYQITKMYKESYRTVNKIALYLYSKFNKKLSEEEEIYLILHINRVKKTKENKSEK